MAPGPDCSAARMRAAMEGEPNAGVVQTSRESETTVADREGTVPNRQVALPPEENPTPRTVMRLLPLRGPESGSKPKKA